MEISIEKLCEIVDGNIMQRGSYDYVGEVGIYPVDFLLCDTFFAINSLKYSTDDCGFGNSGNEDSIFGLKGTQNTHKNIEKMIRLGTKTIIYDEELECPVEKGINYIRVSDSLDALAKYSHYIIGKSSAKIVAITGSTGKTTLTNYLKSILETAYNVQTIDYIRITYIGLIWFIIHELKADTEWIVIEMQIDGKGQIDRLCEIIAIDVAMIINVDTAHIERFGSVENILYEKLGVYRGLKQDGKLIINDESEILHKWRLESDDNRIVPVKRDIVQNSIFADTNFYQDTVAMICEFCKLLDLSVTPEIIRKACDNQNVGRLQLFKGINDSSIIVDTYNGSLISTRYGLDFIKRHKKKRKIIVLGSLLELGECSEEVHRRIGRIIASAEVFDYAVFIGEATIYTMDEAKPKLKWCTHVYTYQAALNALNEIGITEDTVVYIKGSGAMRLELLALQLIGRIETKE